MNNKLDMDLGKDIQTEFDSQVYAARWHTVSLGGKYQIQVFESFARIQSLLENNDILVVEDIQKNIRWGFSSQMQRSLNWERVDNIVNTYLLNHDKKIKFFPPITVALVPFENGNPVHAYQRATGNSKQNADSTIDGLRIEKNPTFAMLSWNRQKIKAITIDGQHRVAALRLAYQREQLAFSNLTIPVIFILLDHEEPYSIIAAIRELFNDVSKTPRAVAEERLIFLDDRNIVRRLTRSMVSEIEFLSDESINWSITKAQPDNLIPYEFLRLRDDRGGEDRGSPPIKFFPIVDLFTLHRIVKDFVFNGWSYLRLVALLDEVLSTHPHMAGEMLSNRAEDQSGSREEAIEIVKDALAAMQELPLLPVYVRYLKDYSTAWDDDGYAMDDDDDGITSEHVRREMDDFSFDARTTEYVLHKLDFIPKYITGIFNRQLWVQNIYEAFRTTQYLQEKPVQQYIQAYLQQKARDMDLNLQDFLHRTAGGDEALMHKVKHAYSEVCRKINYFENGSGDSQAANLLRYSVGQRMIFANIADYETIAAEHGYNDPVDGMSALLGKLEKAGVFRRDFQIPNSGRLRYYFWDNILVRASDDRMVMKPSDGDAMIGWEYLKLLLLKVDSRARATDVRSYNRIIKKLGSPHINIDNWKQMIAEYIEQFGKNLTQDEASTLDEIKDKNRNLYELFNAHRNKVAKLVGSMILAKNVGFVKKILL